MTASRLRPLMLALVLACSTAPEAEPPEESTTIAAAVSTTSTATVVSMPPFPAQPEGVPWPTAEWVVAEWPAQVDKSIVDEATDVAFADGSPDRVRAVVIAHEGAVVYERYSPSVTDGPDVVMPSYSMAKSVAAALVGIVVREGQLELDQAAPVPEWHADTEDPRSAITVEQMLHMSTGMEWSDGLDAGTNMSASWRAPTLLGTRPPSNRHGYLARGSNTTAAPRLSSPGSWAMRPVRTRAICGHSWKRSCST